MRADKAAFDSYRKQIYDYSFIAKVDIIDFIFIAAVSIYKKLIFAQLIYRTSRSRFLISICGLNTVY